MKWFQAVVALAVAAALFLWLANPDSSQDEPPLGADFASSDSLSSPNPKSQVGHNGQLPSAYDASGADQPSSAGAIFREEEQRVVQFLTTEGKPIALEAECYLIESNRVLHERMATFARLGQSLWGDSILFESLSQPATGKLVVDNAYQNAGFLIAFVEGYAPFVGEWTPAAAGETIPIQLESVAPIEVRVLDHNENPIEGAQVWIRYGGTFNHSDGTDDLTQLRQRFFQFGYTTDKEGKVELPTCFEGAHNEVLLIPGSKWGSESFLVESGQSFDYIAKPGFTLKGSVTLDGKIPDRETWVKVLDRTGGNFSQLSSGRVKEEGRYLVEGILATPQVVDVLGSAEGVAIDFVPIVNPHGGDVIELDLQLQSGTGGSLRLSTPWGEPIPDTKVMLRKSAEISTPFAYRTDQDGKAELPQDFIAETSMRIVVHLGNQKYIPSTLFIAGEHTDVCLEFLATITDFQVGKNILGEAKVINAYWLPERPAITGLAEWDPRLGESPLLGAGPGVLRLVLDDDRWLSQRLFLMPEKSQSVDFQVKPATVLCDVGEGPVTISLVSSEATSTHFAKNQRGVLEIPCWEGVFTLKIWWENGFLSMAPFTVVGPTLDLGKLVPDQFLALGGTVTDKQNKPIPNAQINLAASFGDSSLSTQSDEQGDFNFAQVQEGHYQLICSAPSLGAMNSSVTQNVVVRHGFQPASLRIVIPLEDPSQRIIGRSEIPNFGFNHGFLATDGRIQSKEIEADGIFSFAAPQSASWLGSFHADGLRTSARALQVPEGPGSHDLSSLGVSTRSLRFVDENQAPYRDLLVRLELDGMVMPRRLHFDQNGTHVLTVTPAAPWSLSVRSRSGFERRFSFAELGTGPILIPRMEEMRSIHAVAVNGDSIPRFTVQSDDGRLLFSSAQAGRVQVPVSCHADLFATAPGKIPCWLDGSSASETVVLPVAVEAVVIKIAADLIGAASVRWRSDADYSSIWGSDGIESATPGGIIFLPPLAEGGLRLEVLDAKETVLATKYWELLTSGQELAISA